MREPKFTDITVREHADGGWEVLQDGKTTGQLCLGEMLEMVVKLAVPEMPGPRYTMRTPEQMEQRESACECRAESYQPNNA